VTQALQQRQLIVAAGPAVDLSAAAAPGSPRSASDVARAQPPRPRTGAAMPGLDRGASSPGRSARGQLMRALCAAGCLRRFTVRRALSRSRLKGGLA